MQITNHFSVSSVDAVKNAAKGVREASPSETAPSSSLTPVDFLDLSAEAQAIDGSSSVSDDIRVDLVADIRRQIAEGTYDTDEKLSAALDSFLDQLG